MVRQIAALFFAMDIPATLAYYKNKLGFECLGTWQDPPVYANVARDQQLIHFRCAEPPTANPDKYRDERICRKLESSVWPRRKAWPMQLGTGVGRVRVIHSRGSVEWQSCTRSSWHRWS